MERSYNSRRRKGTNGSPDLEMTDSKRGIGSEEDQETVLARVKHVMDGIVNMICKAKALTIRCRSSGGLNSPAACEERRRV